MTSIAFFTAANERGTGVAVFDYAHFNETLLGNRSIIFAPESSRGQSSFQRFAERFIVCYYQTDAQCLQYLQQHSVEVCYHLIQGSRKRGQPTHPMPAGCRIVMHCVFSVKDPAGDVYASISHYLNERRGSSHPVVPHMIHLPEHDETMRADLEIPSDATVFGRYGGSDTFNIAFVHQLIPELVRQNPKLFFIFLNTDLFCEPHPQIIHLPACYDLSEKVRFINTCDAMLHARKAGETFGIAVGEFSIRNKPVLTFAPPSGGVEAAAFRLQQSFNSITKRAPRLPTRTAYEHLTILGDKALRYYNKAQLRAHIVGFDRDWAQHQDWDQYSELYSPAPVMQRFKQVFLETNT